MIVATSYGNSIYSYKANILKLRASVWFSMMKALTLISMDSVGNVEADNEKTREGVELSFSSSSYSI